MTQGFDEWYQDNEFSIESKTDARRSFEAGAESRQAEIDQLKVMIKKLVDNTIIGIDDELEIQANDILKGESNE